MAAIAKPAGRLSSNDGRPLETTERIVRTELALSVPVLSVRAAHGAVSAGVRRVASPLSVAYAVADAVRATPAGHGLGERASQLAGALVSAVASLATTARDALAAVPARYAPSQPRPAAARPQAAARAQLARLPISVAMQSTPPTAVQTILASAALTSAVTGGAALGASSVRAATDPPRFRGATSLSAVATYAHRHRGMTPSAASQGVARSSAGGGARAKPLTATGAPPTPSPAGVSPVSGAGTTGGLSVPMLLVFAGLLLLAAPRAMRRLRLAAGSWRPAQFILIPERPG